MTKKELIDKLNKELDDNDIIDYLKILKKEYNCLEIIYTNNGYSIIGYYKPINYKQHNDPSNNL